MTNAATKTSEMPCTTAKSFDRAACTRAGPRPSRLNARSTTADSAISDVIVMPTTVVTGMAALRSTWRRTISAYGIPRLTAVCTCSRPISVRTATRVTRTTIAIADRASAIAGSVRCQIRSATPVPAPSAGNQPRFTENTNSSTIAATNDGTAARTLVDATIDVSSAPRRRPDTTPRPTPNTTIKSPAYATRPSVTPTLAPMTDITLPRKAIDVPRSPCSTALPSQSTYRVRNGSSRWYWARSCATASGGSVRPPVSVDSGSPGARSSEPKMTKLDTSSAATSIAARRTTKDRMSAAVARAPQEVGPRPAHERERHGCAGELARRDQHRVDRRHRDPRELLHDPVARLRHELRPLRRIRGRARVVHRLRDLRVVERVVVLAAVRHHDRVVEGGRIGVVRVVDRREAVDALARLGVGEEVDEVLRRDGLELHLQADRVAGRPDRVRRRRELLDLARHAERDRLAGGIRLLHELLGLREVLRRLRLLVPVRLEDILAVAPGAGVRERPRKLRVAVVDVLDVGLAVDRERQGLADAHVAERALEARDDDRVAGERRPVADRDLVLGRPQLVDRAEPLRVGAVDPAGEEAARQARVVGHAAEVDLGHLRLVRRVPVVVVADRVQRGPRLPAADLERPGAHEPALRRAELAALGLAVRLLEDDARHLGQLAVEPEVGLLELDRHDLVGRLRHRRDAREHRRVEAAAFGVGRALEAEEHVVGGDGLAVPEGRPVLERDDERLVVGVRQRREARADGAVRRLARQRVAQRRDHRVLGIVERLDRIDRPDVAVGRPGDLPGLAAGRRGGRAQCARRARRGARLARGAGCGLAAGGDRQGGERDRRRARKVDSRHRAAPSSV